MAELFAAAKFPQQVSIDQDNSERSEIAFSNGTSFPSISKYNPQIVDRHTVTDPVTNVQETLSNSIPRETLRTTRRPTPPPRHADYVDYGQRLRSFARWTRSNPDPVCLSEAGFFYTNQSDLVRCFQCGIGLKDFTEGDDPLLEHVRYSGDCNYLQEYLGPVRLSSIKNKCEEQDKEKAIPRNYIQNCRHPELKTYEARLLSFKNWPRHLSQKPETLADAGLFYLGIEDLVRCFMCDGGLRRWDEDDDPWTEHCRWFPDCAYAREKKGDEFIALVKASAEYNSEETGNASSDTEGTGDESVSATMERLSLMDPEINAVLDQHKNICLEMGYDLKDVDEAVKDLRNMGSIKPSIDEILDMVEVVKDRREYQLRIDDIEQSHSEDPLEENKRLKNLVTCMKCRKNSVNALFLPCTHHRLCMECSEQVNQCPVCNKDIRQKIRTYLV
ncbi:baculoviral IAP repeat-containing protein 8-like [Ruditapes philippinarum]|uniref:baculoviral IAP repeat-containing protein 8-like n=1 Tax=Ruditapes philippinarum TaxID=129788 RepID=UPI00295AD4CC|nr:baculoviral IAP repeat-containing protein 8-like [Ruditapes philippinarum]XP_060592058.1 baculoviral IAP repeat-containing protein 8-like [Ruditapes philippinarum]